MERSKLVAMAMVCALSFGACVDDKESETVTELRKAKTEYLTAQAAYETARAQAERVYASIAEKKAEAEIEVEKLKAAAEAALTEAEARAAAAEAERLEKQLEFDLKNMQLEAEKKEAEYKKELQEYLNQLAAAKFETVTEYQEALEQVDETKAEIRTQEMNLLEAQRKHASALAGNALASAKKDSINARIALAQAERTLKEYEALHAASAQEREAQIEEIRAGLDGLAEQVGEAKLAKEKVEAELAAMDVNELRDELYDAWEVLAASESGSKYVDVEGESVWVEVKGHRNSIDYSDLLNVKYYEWEAKRLCGDIEKALKAEEKLLAPLADTVVKLEPMLEDLYAKLEAAEKARDAALAAEETARKAYEAAKTEAEKKAAQEKLTKAEEEATKAEVAYEKALKAYTDYRAGMDAVKVEHQEQAKKVAAYTVFLKETQEAAAICFNGAYAEAMEKKADLDEELAELDETYTELNAKYMDDKGLVNMWDNYKKNGYSYGSGDAFLAQVEKQILTKKGEVEEAKSALATATEVLSDPERIAEKYATSILEAERTAEEELARLNVRLEQEQMVADSYKAMIDAWMAE